MRFFLRIPPLARLGNARHSDQLGYEAEQCMHIHLKDHYRLLDIHANHANSGCPSSIAARSWRHKLLKYAVYNAAKEADLIVAMEPKTRNILLGQFSAQLCQTLFPKKPSKAIQVEIEKIKKELSATKALGPGPERTTREIALNNACRMMQAQHQTKGLRIDVQITDPHTQQEIWVDTTCIHPTCRTRIRSEMKFINSKIKDQELRRNGGQSERNVGEVGQAVTDQTQNKHDVYGPLIDVAKKQTIDGMRTHDPIFLAAAVSTFGELGVETVRLQELLTSAYSRKLAREGNRDDGFSIQSLTAEFRNKFRDRIQVSVAKGLGRMINTCGLPALSCRKYQSKYRQ
jgi:hypothetical protein